jgi:RluA family pseudouridine synthase
MNNPEIIYEDSSILVINKPCGLNSDIDKWGNPSVEEWVKNYYAGKKQVHPVLMHRLDRVTSGLLIISKKPAMTRQLQLAFEQRKIEKKYLAVVHDCSLPTVGTLKHFLSKDPVQKKAVVVQSSALGQEAVLKYKILQRVEAYSLLEIQLLTGRYHQIRAQLAAVGCPVVGDMLYGSNVSCGIEMGIALHAFTLQIKGLISDRNYEWEAKPALCGVWIMFF